MKAGRVYPAPGVWGLLEGREGNNPALRASRFQVTGVTHSHAGRRRDRRRHRGRRRQTEAQGDRHTKTGTDRQADRGAGIQQTGRQKVRQADRKSGRQTEEETHNRQRLSSYVDRTRQTDR